MLSIECLQGQSPQPLWTAYSINNHSPFKGFFTGVSWKFSFFPFIVQFRAKFGSISGCRQLLNSFRGSFSSLNQLNIRWYPFCSKPYSYKELLALNMHIMSLLLGTVKFRYFPLSSKSKFLHLVLLNSMSFLSAHLSGLLRASKQWPCPSGQ